MLAIGKSGQTGSNATEVLKGATGLRVYPKTNELFVSDGYGNSRIMVYDADTGKFKRMWGAYGKKPLDMDARPPQSPIAERNVSDAMRSLAGSSAVCGTSRCKYLCRRPGVYFGSWQ